jgi:hypothetical protein
VAAPTRFSIRFTGVNRGMAALGIDPRSCRVELDEGQLHVHLGWAFRLHAPLADVAAVERDHERVWGWGAHGWRGTWLVNGSSSGLVRITLDPPGHAHAAGVPVTVRVLRVSVDDPDALVEELRRTG